MEEKNKLYINKGQDKTVDIFITQYKVRGNNVSYKWEKNDRVNSSGEGTITIEQFNLKYEKYNGKEQ